MGGLSADSTAACVAMLHLQLSRSVCAAAARIEQPVRFQTPRSRISITSAGQNIRICIAVENPVPRLTTSQVP